jgi:monoamine oxidase
LKVPRVLEASGTTFGGRPQELGTNSFVDVPLDLGPEWIHVHPKILKDLLLFEETEPMPETIVYRPQTYASFNNEKLHRHDWFRYFYAETKFRTTTWYSYLQQFIHPHVSNQLQLDAAVKTIDYSDPEMVQVTTTDGRVYETKHVIVAVPISILQNEDIQFLPAPPPRKQRAWDSVEMAPGLKVWIEFDRDFYPDTLIPGPLFSWFYEDKIYFDALWGKPSDHHVLALFEVGQRAWDHVELENDREIVDSVLEELDDIFDGQASRHYLQHHVQNWSREPFIQGAYSYNWNEYWNDIAPLKESLERRIYFCGEYLAKYNLATVHGAALSGREVAQRLVRSVGK